MIQYLAVVAAWVGEKDLALRTLGESSGYLVSQLRPIEIAAVVGPAPRRSALRTNPSITRS